MRNDDDNSGLIDLGAILAQMRADETVRAYDDAYAEESDRPTLPYPAASPPPSDCADDERPTIPEDMIALELRRRAPKRQPHKRVSMLLVAACAVSLGGNAFAGIVASGTFAKWLGGTKTTHGDAAGSFAHAAPPTAAAARGSNGPSPMLLGEVVVAAPDDIHTVTRATVTPAARTLPKTADTPALARHEPPPATPETPMLLPLPSPAPASAPAEPAVADLMVAMREATGQSSPKAQEPARGSGKQLHPALGALTTALRAVQADARTCLGEADEPRACTVIFGASGAVASVQVPGNDARASCLRAALARAQVDPFEEETYPARVTIRP
jgi:hypothetical protein